MARFRVVHLSQSRDVGEEGWAVERSYPNGKTNIGRLYPTRTAAQGEADRLAAQEIDRPTD